MENCTENCTALGYCTADDTRIVDHILLENVLYENTELLTTKNCLKGIGYMTLF